MEIVNGYVCRNCTDVEYAQRNIDPARPKDGPNGVNAPDKVAKADRLHRLQAAENGQKPDYGPAVTLSGALANVTPPAPTEKAQPYRPGSTLNISA